MLAWLVLLVGVSLLITGGSLLSASFAVLPAGRRPVRGKVPQSAYEHLLRQKQDHSNDSLRSMLDLVPPMPNGRPVRRLAPSFNKTGAPVQCQRTAITGESSVAWLWLAAHGCEESIAIGTKPVTIGFAPDSTIILATGQSGLSERVRVWQRDGRFMLHNLSRGGDVKVGGKPVTWVVLEDGDDIEIAGRHVIFQRVPNQETSRGVRF